MEPNPKSPNISLDPSEYFCILCGEILPIHLRSTHLMTCYEMQKIKDFSNSFGPKETPHIYEGKDGKTVYTYKSGLTVTTYPDTRNS